MEYLYINFLLYFAYTIYYWKKAPYLTFHNMISIWITIVAGIGIFSVQFGYYQTIYGENLSFSLEAYFWGFIAFFISMWPFRLLNCQTLSFIGLSSKLESMIKTAMKICMVLFTIIFFIYCRAAIHALQFDPAEVYASQHYEGKMLYEYTPLERFLDFYVGLIYNTLNPLFLFYSLIIFAKKQTHNYKLCSCQVFLTCMIAFCQSIMTGARGGIFVFVSLLIIVAVPFWKHFDIFLKSKVKKCIFFFGFIVFIYIVSMTISRFDEAHSETPIEGIIRYFGEPFPNLGHLLWDKVDAHPMGLRLYPYFFMKKTVATGASSITEEFYAWETITGVPLYVFKTEFGDFYIEFGKYIGLFVMSLYTLFFSLFIRKGKIEIAALPIFYYFLDIEISSPMDFAKRYYLHFIILILCIITYFVIRYFSDKKEITNI